MSRCCARCSRKPFLTTCGNETCRCHPEARTKAALSLGTGQQALRETAAHAETNPTYLPTNGRR